MKAASGVREERRVSMLGDSVTLSIHDGVYGEFLAMLDFAHSRSGIVLMQVGAVRDFLQVCSTPLAVVGYQVKMAVIGFVGIE